MKYAKFSLLLSMFFSGPIFAGPADYVYTPTVEHGEREIDFKYGSAKQPSGDRQQAASIGFGYGATEYWFTEVYLKYDKSSIEGMHLDAFEWENKFQLTETGKFPVDIGLIAELEIPHKSDDPYELKLGTLFQTEFGKTQLNGNIFVERKYGSDVDGDEGPHNMEMGYQWQAKYRWQPAFEFGMQGFGEMGKWDNWDSRNLQAHRIGPAVFGKIKVGNRQTISYNAAWLFGASQAAASHTLRIQTEYEF